MKLLSVCVLSLSVCACATAQETSGKWGIEHIDPTDSSTRVVRDVKNQSNTPKKIYHAVKDGYADEIGKNAVRGEANRVVRRVVGDIINIRLFD